MRFSFRGYVENERPRRRALRELYKVLLRRDDPHARSLRLLRNWLSPEQLRQLSEKNYFDVVGCHTGTRYRIHYGVTSNVIELDPDGRPLTGRCFLPEGRLGPGDVMLAQKIALETDENTARAVGRPFVVPVNFRRLVGR
jgi:hypothetical protein